MTASFDRAWRATTYEHVDQVGMTHVAAMDLGLRGHQLLVPLLGRYQAVDLHSVALSFGRYRHPRSHALDGTIVYLHSPSGIVRVVGQLSLLSDRCYTQPDGNAGDLTLSPEDFEDLVATLEGLGLSAGRSLPQQAGYRDARGVAAEPVTIALRRAPRPSWPFIGSALGVVFAVFAAALGSQALGGNPVYWGSSGFGVSLLIAIVFLLRLPSRYTGGVGRLVLMGRELHLQSPDGATALATVRIGEAQLERFSRERSYRGYGGIETQPADYLPVMRLHLPGRSTPLHFSTEDRRLRWKGRGMVRLDHGPYGFSLSGAEFFTVATALGVADELEFDPGSLERRG